MDKKIITLYDNALEMNLQATKKILSYTPILWQPGGKKKSPRPLGSGVLYTANGKYYLLTAAHCIIQEELLIQVGISGKTSIVAVRGSVFMNQGKDNSIDVAVVQLEGAALEACQERYLFLTRSQLVNVSDVEAINEFLVVGYPASATFIHPIQKKIDTTALVHLCVAKSDAQCRNMGFDPSVHIAVGFSQRKSSFMDSPALKNMAPDPRGVSGGGLWYIRSYFTQEPRFYLAGLMIEHHPARSIMLATKINNAIALIDKFDE